MRNSRRHRTTTGKLPIRRKQRVPRETPMGRPFSTTSPQLQLLFDDADLVIKQRLAEVAQKRGNIETPTQLAVAALHAALPHLEVIAYKRFGEAPFIPAEPTAQ